MYKFNLIYGYIKIDRDYYKSVKFIKELGKDDSYPFVNTNMFSFGDYERPYYYEDIPFSFAATYKYFGLDLEDWNVFILKIENILNNISFETASFHINSSIGDYVFTWEKLLESQEKKYDHNNIFFAKSWSFKITFNTGSEENDIKGLTSMGFEYPVAKRRNHNN
ncbi:hypothetical protein [Winogradskyella poriferorum]|uniref:hypothetical protein n=1 Tax=Winogradskyella poriferorum TaxID=307627 RepID=UPI003D65BA2A